MNEITGKCIIFFETELIVRSALYLYYISLFIPIVLASFREHQNSVASLNNSSELNCVSYVN